MTTSHAVARSIRPAALAIPAGAPLDSPQEPAMDATLLPLRGIALAVAISLPLWGLIGTAGWLLVNAVR